MDYPVTLEHDDNNAYLVSFVDFPEAHTFGTTKADALARGADALATVIDAYIKDRRDIPTPSAVTRYHVTMPALVETKVYLYKAMRAARVTKSELARRLDVHLPQIDRLLEMTHGSKLQQIEAAFSALGKRLVVGVEDVPRPTASKARRDTRRTAGARRAHATAGDRRGRGATSS